MRADAANENGIAIDDEMMRRDRPRHSSTLRTDELDAVAGGDMLHHNPQLGNSRAQWGEDALDEHSFTIKDIDLGIGHFAMHAERHADFGHALKNRIDILDIAHTAVR